MKKLIRKPIQLIAVVLFIWLLARAMHRSENHVLWNGGLIGMVIFTEWRFRKLFTTKSVRWRLFQKPLWFSVLRLLGLTAALVFWDFDFTISDFTSVLEVFGVMLLGVNGCDYLAWSLQPVESKPQLPKN